MMIRSASFAAIAFALANCGHANPSSRNEPESSQARSIARLDLTSSAFANGSPIPKQYSCDGANETPALRWGEPPRGTKSFALVIDDPDAPNGTFRHWGVFDIPRTARSIGGAEKVGVEVANDAGTRGYKGPCPPPGNGVHHYHFKLFALAKDKLGLDPASARIADVEQAAAKQALAQGTLMGTYERK